MKTPTKQASPVGSRRSRDGYLVIADISGYTAFLTATELEHAQSIIGELTQLIRSRLSPLLRFVKLEGDAVFCYADAERFVDGERFIELLEICYFEFSNLVFNMVRSTTCTCAACASIHSLDLKFVAHFGTFVVDAEEAHEDLAGPAVILAHRLLKNSVVDETGIAAYAFLTDSCLSRLGLPFAVPLHSEAYDSFGVVTGGVHDLRPSLQRMRDAHREYVSAEDADHETIIKVPHPPAVVWGYAVNPIQRLRWACVMFNKDPDEVTLSQSGRSGVGAKVHCNHGPAEAYREIVDWRPFNYFTARGAIRVRAAFAPSRRIVETFEFTPMVDGGTMLTWRIRFLERGWVSGLTLRATKLLFRGGIAYGQKHLIAAIGEDLSAHAESSEVGA